MTDRRLQSYFRRNQGGFRWSDLLRRTDVPKQPIDTPIEPAVEPVIEPLPELGLPTASTPHTYSTSPLQRRSYQRVEEAEWTEPFLGESSHSSGAIVAESEEEQLDDSWETVNIGGVLHRFKRIQTDFSSDFEEDLTILQSNCFFIDYPNGRLGSGTFGVVYRGYYGTDVTPKAFSKVEAKYRFAVKVIDFSGSTLFMRECFENEKFIMYRIEHKNCVKIKNIVNLGEQRTLAFRSYPDIKYKSPDRAYLFMEYADGGTLENWLDNNNRRWQPGQRIKFIRDIFSGMRYLHQQRILHGDIHAGNILLFTEGVILTAKWTDFGLSKVATLEQYEHRNPVISEQYFFDNCRTELMKMIDIFKQILENRMRLLERPEQTFQLNEYQRMVDNLCQPFSTAEELFDQFRDVLDED